MRWIISGTGCSYKTKTVFQNDSESQLVSYESSNSWGYIFSSLLFSNKYLTTTQQPRFPVQKEFV